MTSLQIGRIDKAESKTVFTGHTRFMVLRARDTPNFSISHQLKLQFLNFKKINA